MNREQPFDSPHLLACSHCGIANGLNAMRCWSCGAELPGARRRGEAPLVEPLPLADTRAARARHTSPGARRRIGAVLAAAVVLLLATFVWTPPSPPPALAPESTGASESTRASDSTGGPDSTRASDSMGGPESTRATGSTGASESTGGPGSAGAPESPGVPESTAAREPHPTATPNPAPRMATVDASTTQPASPSPAPEQVEPVAARATAAGAQGADDAAPADRDAVVRALGLDPRQRDGAQAPRERKGCDANDVALGLCAAQPPATEPAPAEQR